MPITAIEHPWLVKRRQLLEQFHNRSEGFFFLFSYWVS